MKILLFGAWLFTDKLIQFTILVFSEEEITVVITSRQQAATIQIETIANNTRTQLALLEKKYATPDKFKRLCGLIGIISISVLFGSVLINDFVNLLMFIFGKEITRIKIKRHVTHQMPNQIKPRYIPGCE